MINPKDNSFLVTLKLDSLSVTLHHMHLSKAETDRLERIWTSPDTEGLVSSSPVKIVDVRGDVHQYRIGQIIGITKRAFDPERAKKRQS